MKGLTKRQKETLRDIQDYVRDHQRPPTVRELAEMREVTVTAAFGHLRALEAKGYLKRDRYEDRGLMILKSPDEELPLAGDVNAGWPVDVWENVEQISFADFFRYGNQAMRVADDSLESEQLAQGDYVIGGFNERGQPQMVGVIRLIGSRRLDNPARSG